jgi:hypothetical protein
VNGVDPSGLDDGDLDPAENGGGSIPLGEQQEMEHGGADRDVEQTNEDLNSFTIGNGQSFDTKADARSALLGDAGTSANRFFRDATGKSINFRIDPASEDGGYRLSFYSPANNEGYGKLYVQEISANGDVIREYKEVLYDGNVIEPPKYLRGGPCA